MLWRTCIRDASRRACARALIPMRLLDAFGTRSGAASLHAGGAGRLSPERSVCSTHHEPRSCPHVARMLVPLGAAMTFEGGPGRCARGVHAGTHGCLSAARPSGCSVSWCVCAYRRALTRLPDRVVRTDRAVWTARRCLAGVSMRRQPPTWHMPRAPSCVRRAVDARNNAVSVASPPRAPLCLCAVVL
jgi:hypothetical protein